MTEQTDKKPNLIDRCELIIQGWDVYKGGRYAIGAQVNFDLEDLEKTERYAVIMDLNETRFGFAFKLRQLADAVEHGKGGVRGENDLSGHELNAGDYPEPEPLKDLRDRGDIHEADFRSARYEKWKVEVMRAIDGLIKSKPKILP